VTINLDEDESSFHIAVADNGPGVPEAIRKTMFLPFVSVGKERGVGLGLTLAQQIAQEHGGDIQLSETVEGNSVFTINLPKAALRALGAVVDRKALQPR
jgi:nitrogen-specific signal transduction histidine kinase